jgi:hypothetical protein
MLLLLEFTRWTSAILKRVRFTFGGLPAALSNDDLLGRGGKSLDETSLKFWMCRLLDAVAASFLFVNLACLYS